MKQSILQSALIAVALILCTNVSSLAAEKQPGASAESKASPKAESSAKNAKAKKAKPAAKAKLVDINSANKNELKKLPGIGDAEADKIIAGRPYGSKAHLVTRKVVPAGVYEQLKSRVIARQRPEYLKELGRKDAKK